jgi:hydrogenase maturation protease
MNRRILVAGIGNIFLGDDAFGSEVARLMAHRTWQEGVEVRDYGIRSFDLAYALLERWNAVVIIDALSLGEAPGTLYCFAPDLNASSTKADSGETMDMHGMDPVRILKLAQSLAGEVLAYPVLLIGCEPTDFGDELEGRMGLSPAVKSALEEAVRMTEQAVKRLLAPDATCSV